MTDVQELGLESEPVSFGNVSPSKIRERLRTNGATADEIAFLMEGQRVELNAMTPASALIASSTIVLMRSLRANTR
jgi:hypothetical protein